MKKMVGESMCMGLIKEHAHKHVISVSIEMEGDDDGSDKENAGVSQGSSSELGSWAAKQTWTVSYTSLALEFMEMHQFRGGCPSEPGDNVHSHQG